MRFVAATALALFAALTAAACDDAPAALNRGGFSLSFTRDLDNPPMPTCSTTGHNSNVGQVSLTDASGLETDASNGATINCTVADAGGGSFSVSGTASENLNSLTITIPSISLANSTQDKAAHGSASFSSPTTITAFTSSKPCDFWIDASHGQTVSSGRIWVSFECPEVVSGAQVCGLQSGAAAFDDCDTSS